ncbi:DUF624 domain-containing protein [Gracilibacillus alcaliphilus]|uniref:DUF624 domain-containing protein n=1 Tax=Gracilibacillus alcaliphilus TaxID=1401441 RepID=UPI001959B41B|nr:putative membrane protein YesL [Gracilibacillus alcaliphilus]
MRDIYQLPEHGFIGFMSKLVMWIVQLAYLNLLWILFSLIGVVFLGIAPATLALIVCCKQLMQGREDTSLFRNFVRTFFQNFIPSNSIFCVLTAVGLLFYTYTAILASLDGGLYYLVLFVFVSTVIPFLLVTMYILPVMSQYKVSLLTAIKYAFVTAIVSPLTSMMLLIVLMGIVVLLSIFPVLIPFYSISLFTFSLTFFSQRIFRKMERKESVSPA